MHELPVLPLRDPELIIFPGQTCEIDVGRTFSLNAIKHAQENNNNKIIVAFQKRINVTEPKAEDFHTIAIEAEIKQVAKMPSEDKQERSRVMLTGTHRLHLKTVEFKDQNYYAGKVSKIIEQEITIDDSLIEKINALRQMIKVFVPSLVSVKLSTNPTNTTEFSTLVDDLLSQIKLTGEEKISLLKQTDPIKRFDKLFILTLSCISPRAGSKQQVAEPEVDGVAAEIKKIEENIKVANMPPDALKISEQELKRLRLMSPNNSEFQVTLNYLDILTTLPWSKSSEDSIDITLAKKCLDEDHYGLDKVKERILEFLAVRKLAPNQKGSILCLAGPPGCGKTSVAKSIARSMNKEYLRISCGGMHDESEIRGHRKTYIGAMPGRIIQSIKKAGVNNPLFVLDEIDKLSKDYRGDPGSAMLEVLDPEQNNTFQDNYINTPFDLSKVFFVVTANDISTISPALRDRLEIIEIPGYSPFDKLRIAQGYLIPKQKKEKGLDAYDINISEKAISKIIEEYTCEAGVRSLERQCGTIMRKLAVIAASNKKPPVNINVNLVSKYLGAPRIFSDKMIEVPTVGISTGLAWSQSGGSVLFVESMKIPGKGNVKVTGNAGKVLQESSEAAFTWIRAHAKEYGIDLDKVNETDIHIHLPAGATPKDGPSAGIALTASLLSTLTNIPVRNDVAMTGEISLRGRVLPIGGLKEKVLAAHRAGIKIIIFPKDNQHDVEDIPSDVLNELTILPVTDLKEALKVLLNLEAKETTEEVELKASSEVSEPVSIN